MHHPQSMAFYIWAANRAPGDIHGWTLKFYCPATVWRTAASSKTQNLPQAAIIINGRGGEKRAQQAKELSNILREHIFALFAGGAGYYIIKELHIYVSISNMLLDWTGQEPNTLLTQLFIYVFMVLRIHVPMFCVSQNWLLLVVFIKLNYDFKKNRHKEMQ